MKQNLVWLITHDFSVWCLCDHFAESFLLAIFSYAIERYCIDNSLSLISSIYERVLASTKHLFFWNSKILSELSEQCLLNSYFANKNELFSTEILSETSFITKTKFWFHKYTIFGNAIVDTIQWTYHSNQIHFDAVSKYLQLKTWERFHFSCKFICFHSNST